MRKRNILVVDDDLGLLRQIEKSLEKEFNVLLSSSLDQANTFLSAHEIDLIILDFNLGRDNGHDFLDHVRNKSLNIPVIVISGCLNLEMSVGFLKRQISDFIEKPFTLKDLKSSIEKCLGPAENSLILKSATRSVNVGDKIIQLTPIEFSILEFFKTNTGKRIDRNEIIESIWKGRQVSLNTFDTHLVNLKKKIPAFAEKLTSVYGGGYCYEE